MSDLQMCPVMSGTGIFAADDLDYAVAELAFILFQHPIDAFRVFVDWWELLIFKSSHLQFH